MCEASKGELKRLLQASEDKSTKAEIGIQELKLIKGIVQDLEIRINETENAVMKP